MICLHYSKHFLCVEEYWFWNDTNPPPPSSTTDVLLLRQAPLPIGRYAQQFTTLVTDLSRESDAIFNGFRDHCRRKIRRAIKEGVVVETVVLTDEALMDFVSFHDKFALSIGLRTANHRKLVLLRSADCLSITKARYDGQDLVYHVYIRDRRKARLLYSCSHFRSCDSGARTLVGLGNRYLHWYDMLVLKQQGCLEYDWGGIGDDSDMAVHGINSFKREFCGLPERSYHCLIPASVWGTMGVEVMRLRGDWRPSISYGFGVDQRQ